eukprot:CAMPEP_0197310916 /NCGR_PEP_ID=MMETSP0891-20130614/9449_1 /TAXON_ID=44058 ORGANISM="Aureoumbra lagunensis, Strain CCMP1510" /NCGR_SAMPLE_ID=MMETSP0891 /ASSEMBLY_ACC=CAM_ASM_000534 /LENGTH=559 /DNA_ID=CAMNT_0042796783 /DNA_START=332 /DNA_END=2011 /DNA_ORIENTATION=+
MENVVIRHCVSAGNGGAIAITNMMPSSLSDILIDSCTATSGYGGALSLDGDGDMYCERCFFICASSSLNAGAVFIHSSFTGTLFVIDSLFQENIAKQGFGGAIYAIDNTIVSMVFVDTVFRQNTALYGGAIAVSTSISQKIHFQDCDFLNNSAVDNSNTGIVTYGGAFFVKDTVGFTNNQYIACASFFNTSVFHFSGSRNRFLLNFASAGGMLYLHLAKDLDIFSMLSCDITSALGTAPVIVEGNFATSYGDTLASSVVAFNVSDIPVVAPSETFTITVSYSDAFANRLAGQHERIALTVSSITPGILLRQLNRAESESLFVAASNGNTVLDDVYIDGKIGESYSLKYLAEIADVSFIDYRNSTLDLICPAAYYLDHDICIKCPAGTASDTRSSATSCNNCAPGYFTSTTGSTYCQRCPRGRATAFEGSNYCEICEKDEYADKTGSTKCSKCPANSERVLRVDNVLDESFSSILGINITQCLCISGTYSSQINTTHADGHILRRDGRDANWGLTGVKCFSCPRGGVCDGATSAPRNKKKLLGRSYAPAKIHVLWITWSL